MRRPVLALPLTALVAGWLALAPAVVRAQAAEAPLAPAVTVTRAVERELVERAIVTGTLVPREEVLVAPEIEGLRITEVLVEEGDQVQRGQVLARLSRDILETTLAQNGATLARAEAAIAQARSQIMQAEAAQVEAAQALERTRALMRGGNTTEVQLEQRVAAARAAEARLAAARDGLMMAEAEKRSAEAARREIEVRLARTEIKAPHGGIVTRRNARIGATATAAGDPLFRIVADGEIELEGEVTETQLLRILEGAAAAVTLGPRTIAGRVRNVFPEVDRATRLGKVRISLGSDPALRPGAFARGTVELARRRGVAIPTASVIYGAEGPSIQVVADDQVQSRSVRTGLSADGFVEIQEGLAAGELVVAKAGSFLRGGDRVRPVLAESAEARGRL
ncbi:MAG TPA: efflux RND transporter periplasmic adaptor subunit [Microvirga sp.]|nr:efflux RND transporter periplasmic adaptor subunit [Microvirga sp.]